MKKRSAVLSTLSLTLVLLALLGFSLTVQAAQVTEGPQAPNNSTYQTLPFSQAWTNTGLITVNDDWSSVPGIIGYLGDYTSASPTNVDPQTLLTDTVGVNIDVIANQAAPNTNTSGGVAEFDGIADPVVALQGSGTADAPHIVLHLNTTGLQDIVVSYNVRDVDGSADNAVQQVALHYRVGASGDFTNLLAGYIADATAGPSAIMTTSVVVTLPAAANNQAQVQLRIMTTNATGSDEWVGIDDIVITGTPLPAANLGISKAGPATANAGDPITYTLDLSNTGSLAALAAVITDSLPSEVTFVTYTTAMPVTFTQLSAQTLVWELGEVNTGASATIIVHGTVSAGASGNTVFTNTVTASTTTTETQLANNTSSVATLIPVPDLVILKTGPATASAGDTIDYTIAVANSGTATAAGVSVTDTLPAEVTFVTYTASLPASFSQAGQTLVWNLGDVAVDAGGLITVQGTIAPATSNGTFFTNTVTAASTTPEVVTANNTATAATLVGASDLVLVKTGPASVLVGDAVVYTLDYSNTGDLNATGVVLVDQLPAGLTYVSDSLGTGTLAGNTITWTLGTVATNATGSVVLTATANTIGTKVNLATINGSTADSNPEDNTAVFTTTVQGGDPYVAKSAPARIFGGDVVSYTITYGNYGDVPAAVTITDTLPLSFTIVNDTSGWPFVDAGNTRSWTTTIPASTTGLSFTLAVQVPTDIATGTRVTNTLTLETAVVGNDPGNDSAEAGSTVYQFTSIHDIQYVDDPDISDTSSYSGTWVAVEGVVIANPSSFLSSGGLPYRYYIEDPAGGPWSGLYIYRGTANPPGVVEGDHVRLYGLLVEFVQGGSNQTELDLSRTGAFQMVVSSGNPLPAPANLLTEDFINAGTAEQWESVLIEFQNALVTNPNISNGEWKFNNSNGDAIGDDNAKAGGNTVFTYVPQLNDHYKFIRGIGNQSFGTYKIEPRYNADVVLDFPVTFVYHDLEDAVLPGENVELRGDFNGWGGVTMAHDAGYTVFSVTVTLPTTATQGYKYFVTGLSGNAGWDMLNTDNRSVTPARGLTLQDEYRNVTIGWGNLNGPASQTINLGSPSASIDGQLYVQEVTNPAGAGRGLKAEVGYGSTANPAGWTWSAMAYASQTGNNDVYAGVITPTASGVYSYATRYNGNWGAGNPNSQWVYGDLNGIPFSLDQTGVLTVTAPQLAIDKAVETASAEVNLGEVVTYTFTLSNTGDGTATSVLITDVLPAGVNFGGFVQQNGAAFGSGAITWSGSLNAGASATVIFTATVKNEQALYGTDILNTVLFTADNGGSGSDSVAFAIVKRYFTYLPLIKR